MTNPIARRPLPALVALLALLLLTALVWWRVLHRSSAASSNPPCPTPSASSTLPAQANVTVIVLNSTTRAGIASKARLTLINDGFSIPEPAANDTKSKNRIHGVAEIRFGPSGRSGATLLHYYFPGARMVDTNAPNSTVIVSLGAKFAAVASSTAVQAELNAAKVALASNGPTGSAGPSPAC